MITTRLRHALGSATLVVALASLSLSCSGSQGSSTPSEGKSPSHAAHEVASTASADELPASDTAEPVPDTEVPDTEKVRDVFARLQATYNDGCTTPGNCEYFLERLLDELTSLDTSMKADPQGPEHFPDPLAWIAKMQAALGDDTSYENLKKHQDLLTGTRDKINSWMQGHPEDYR